MENYYRRNSSDRVAASTKRNLTKGAFTLKFYAFYDCPLRACSEGTKAFDFKIYTNSPEFHLVLAQGDSIFYFYENHLLHRVVRVRG